VVSWLRASHGIERVGKPEQVCFELQPQGQRIERQLAYTRRAP
jgi:hypothetical protein